MPQVKSFSLSNFLEVHCSRWEPVTKKLYPDVVGVQPGQRGWQSKCVRFVCWLCENYSPGFPPPDSTIRWWILSGKAAAGWDGWFYLVEQKLNG